jgi:hypothetical protein
VLWRNVAKILSNCNGTTPLFLPLKDECAEPLSKDSFSRGGAHIPTRGKNNGATTTDFFHSFK